MNEYDVTWAIQIDADSPVDAAEQALAIMRDPDSTATVFRVECRTASVLVDVEEADDHDSG